MLTAKQEVMELLKDLLDASTLEASDNRGISLVYGLTFLQLMPGPRWLYY
jgi:hypothetical protein